MRKTFLLLLIVLMLLLMGCSKKDVQDVESIGDNEIHEEETVQDNNNKNVTDLSGIWYGYTARYTSVDDKTIDLKYGELLTRHDGVWETLLCQDVEYVILTKLQETDEYQALNESEKEEFYNEFKENLWDFLNFPLIFDFDKKIFHEDYSPIVKDILDGKYGELDSEMQRIKDRYDPKMLIAFDISIEDQNPDDDEIDIIMSYDHLNSHSRIKIINNEILLDYFDGATHKMVHSDNFNILDPKPKPAEMSYFVYKQELEHGDFYYKVLDWLEN